MDWWRGEGAPCLLSRDPWDGCGAGRCIPDFSFNSPTSWEMSMPSSCLEAAQDQSCSLLMFTPVGEDPVRIWFPICLMPWFLHYFPLIWIIVFFVISQWSSFSPRLHSSLNCYIKNAVLESRVSVLVLHNLKSKVACCSSPPMLECLVWQASSLVSVALPTIGLNAVGAFILRNGFPWRLFFSQFEVRMVQSVVCVF